MNHPFLVPFARTAGHYSLALIALLVPEVGENRLIVAGLLAFLFGPLALLVSLKLDEGRHSTVEPMIDMVTLLVIVFFLPELWFYALIIAVIIALAPSIAISNLSYWYYAANSAVLVVGMTAIALFHEVDGWMIPIAILVAVFPSTFLYSYSLSRTMREMRQRAESLSALQLISGGVAHDFNNILMGIAGYVELAKMGISDAKTLEQTLNKIISSTEKASQLTNQLITFAGNKQIEYKPVDYRREVESIVQSAAGSAKTGIKVSVNLPQEPVFVHGDAIQVSQVVLNLVVNAIDAIETEGQVSVRLTVEDGQAVLEVEDTGTGVEPYKQANIFEPFVSSKERGHGLGLAVARNIVSDHGGDIQLTSELGRGSVFKVRLPAIEVESTELQQSNQILIADDEQAIRMILRQLLESAGYEVIEAADGTAFVDLFGELKNELCAVILDVKMPGKTGWQCLEEVRAFSPDLPVLMISGYDPHGPESAGPDEAMQLLAKPFRIAEVRDTISELISRRG